MRLFCDLDGVMADFDTHYENCFGTRPSKAADNVDWQRVRDRPGFYQDIPLMPDAMVLWDFIRHHNPTFLTGVPWSVPEAPQNKRDMVAKHFGPDVPVITCRSVDKCNYALPGDILIDDWAKHQERWESRGGIWITHTNAQKTILDLFSIISPRGLTRG